MSETPQELHEQQTALSLAEIPVDMIRPNAHQPRVVFDMEELEGLAASIRSTGVLQPLTVRPLAGGQWELVMGERRLRAARIAGLSSVPAVIRHVRDEAMLLEAVAENLHRVDLNPIEEALAYRHLLDTTGMRQEDLARQVGRSRTSLNQVLGILRLPAIVQRMVSDGTLSRGHAVRLQALREPSIIIRLARRIERQKLSVHQLEEILALGNLPGWEEDPLDPYGLTGAADPPAPHWEADDSRRRQRGRRPAASRHLPEVSAVLDDWLCTPVSVRVPRGRQRGRVVIEYVDDVDLARILAQIGAPTQDMAWSPRVDEQTA